MEINHHTDTRIHSKYLKLYDFIINMPCEDWQPLPKKLRHEEISSLRTILYRMAKDGAFDGCRVKTSAESDESDRLGRWILSVYKTKGNRE